MSYSSTGEARIDPVTGNLQFFFGGTWNYIIPEPKTFTVLEYTEEPNPSNFMLGAVRIDPVTGKLQIFSGKRWVSVPQPSSTHSQEPIDELLPPLPVVEEYVEAYERAKKAVADM